MDGIDYAELERRLNLNEAESDKDSGSKGDLGILETIFFVATVVGIAVVAILWRQL